MICSSEIHEDIQKKAYQSGYDAAVKDVVSWLLDGYAKDRKVGLLPGRDWEDAAEAIGLGEAKGAASE